MSLIKDKVMQIQMVDLHSQYLRYKSEIDNAMNNVLSHSLFINGPEVKRFQHHLASYLNVKHVIPCGNGTDALQIALMSLGLNPGDEVITSNFTFIATVEVIALLGLKPVLVDVDKETFNIDVENVKSKITSRTKAIIPVHLFGQSSNMQEILEVAKNYNVCVVEDAAQCLGAEYVGGSIGDKKLGTIGDIGCTSFFPSKNLGCYGDGGACMTDNDELADRIRQISNHGSKHKYYHETIGVNSRLDTMQAAILDVKLNYLDDFNQRRIEVANYYDDHLSGIDQIEIPKRVDFSTHVFHQYTLRIKDGLSDELKEALIKKGIPSMIYYPVPIHRQKAFRDMIDTNEKFPVSDQLCDEVLSLPIHSEMTDEKLKYIVSEVKSFFK